jgi:hypothetical protein
MLIPTVQSGVNMVNHYLARRHPQAGFARREPSVSGPTTANLHH